MRKILKGYWLILLLSLPALASTACSQEDNPVSTPTSRLTATSTLQPTSTSESTPPVISSPTLVATVPEISANRQIIDDSGEVTIQYAFANQDGWIVVYKDEDGRRGQILGYSPVPEGENENITVSIDPLRAGDALYIALHADGGERGSFEFPGPDHPLEYQSQPVEDHIVIDNRATIPELVVSNQEVLEDGRIAIDRVATTKPGWLVIHNDNEGQPGSLAAFAPVSMGTTENLTLTVEWREATTTLHAVLYEDGGEEDVFEDPEIDPPVMLEDMPVSASFKATYPPDLLVLHQPVVDGQIVVDYAVSYGPGWLVVYFDDEGQLGNIIGEAQLEDGRNENIVVDVVESAVTPVLHLMLHQDTDDIGEFEFPRADPMVMYQDMVPDSFSFRTDAGNYLITRDQALSNDNEVIIPLIVVDTEAWIALYNDVDGEIGDMIGSDWLSPGLHRDVAVEIDPELITSNLHAVLHLDSGVLRVFEYPDGPDVILRRNLNTIDSPFSITTGDDDS